MEEHMTREVRPQGEPSTPKADHSLDPIKHRLISLETSNISYGHHEIERKITNPFRRRQMERARALKNAGANNTQKDEDTSNDSLSPPPSKAVFNDLQSAHLSITSRNARKRGATIVAGPSEVPSDGLPVAALSQNFSTSSSPPPSSKIVLRHFPVPPVPAVLAPEPPVKCGPSGYPIERQTLPKQVVDNDKVAPQQYSSAFSSIWNAPMPGPRVDDPASENQNQSLSANTNLKEDDSIFGSEATTLPSASPGLPKPQYATGQCEKRMNRLPRDHLCLPDQQFPSSPAPTNPWLQSYSKKFSGSSRSMNGSILEHSTVGDIYRHYEATYSSQVEGGGTGSSKDRANIITGIPSETVDSSPLSQENMQIASRDVESGTPSDESYGDSQALLEVPEAVNQAQNPTVAAPTMGIETALSVAVSTVPSLTQVNWKNRYTSGQYGLFHARNDSRPPLFPDAHPPVAPQAAAAPQLGEPGMSFLSTESHRALERDISQELRRASAFSVESISPSVYEAFEVHYDPVTDGQGNLTVQRPLDLTGFNSAITLEAGQGSQTIAAAPSATCYNSGAISPGWVGTSQNIRVPINGYYSESPVLPHIRPAPSAPPVRNRSQQDDDQNDWETVGGSTSNSERPNGYTGVARRTGSSIADTSDAGSVSMIMEDAYGSTDRIVQHPAPVDGHTKYSMKDVTNGDRPVLLPIHTDYKANGFPSNSSRIRPPNRVYENPTPLRQRHQNPFGSSPPEIFSPTRAYLYKNFKAKDRSQFPPTTSTIGAVGSGTPAHRADGKGMRRVTDQNRRFSDTHNWMRGRISADPVDDQHEIQPANTLRDERPTSWGLVTAFANNESVRGYTQRGTRIVPDGDQFDGNDVHDQASTIQSNAEQSCNHHRRLPPGGLYNSLRETPARSRKSRQEAPSDFNYRSPLAPPKTQEARRMYSESQLLELENFARRDGFGHGREASTNSSGPSQRYLFQAPVLTVVENRRVSPDSQKTLNIVSLVLLGLCPPLLLCSALGFFDSLLECLMRGRVRGYSTSYKLTAFAIFWLELCVVGVAVGATASRQTVMSQGY